MLNDKKITAEPSVVQYDGEKYQKGLDLLKKYSDPKVISKLKYQELNKLAEIGDYVDKFKTQHNVLSAKENGDVVIAGTTVTAPEMSEQDVKIFDFSKRIAGEDKFLATDINKPANEQSFNWGKIYSESGIDSLDAKEDELNQIQSEMSQIYEKSQTETISPEEIQQYEDLQGSEEKIVSEYNQIKEEVNSRDFNEIFTKGMTPNHPAYINNLLNQAQLVARGIADPSTLDYASEKDREMIDNYDFGIAKLSGVDENFYKKERRENRIDAIINVVTSYTKELGNEIADLLTGKSGNWRSQTIRSLEITRKKYAEEGANPRVIDKLDRQIVAHKVAEKLKTDYLEDHDPKAIEKLERISAVTGVDEVKRLEQEIEPLIDLQSAYMIDPSAAKFTQMGVEIGKGFAELAVLNFTLGSSGLNLLKSVKGLSQTSQVFMISSALRNVPKVASGEVPVGDAVIDLASSYAIGEFMGYINKGQIKNASEIAKKINLSKTPTFSEKAAIPISEAISMGKFLPGVAGINAATQLAKTGEIDKDALITDAAIYGLFRLMGSPGRIKAMQKTLSPGINKMRAERILRGDLSKSEKFTKDRYVSVEGKSKTAISVGQLHKVFKLYPNVEREEILAPLVKELAGMGIKEKDLRSFLNLEKDIVLSSEQIVSLSDKPFWEKFKEMGGIKRKGREVFIRGNTISLKDTKFTTHSENTYKHTTHSENTYKHTTPIKRMIGTKVSVGKELLPVTKGNYSKAFVKSLELAEQEMRLSNDAVPLKNKIASYEANLDKISGKLGEDALMVAGYVAELKKEIDTRQRITPAIISELNKNAVNYNVPKAFVDAYQKKYPQIEKSELLEIWENADNLKRISSGIDDLLGEEEPPKATKVESKETVKPTVETKMKLTYKDEGKYHQKIPEITRINPKKLKVLMDGEVTSISREDADKMNFSEPVDVNIFNSGEIGISDGHHRVAAAKLLNLDFINVNVQAINAKGKDINALIREGAVTSGTADTAFQKKVVNPDYVPKPDWKTNLTSAKNYVFGLIGEDKIKIREMKLQGELSNWNDLEGLVGNIESVLKLNKKPAEVKKVSYSIFKDKFDVESANMLVSEDVSGMENVIAEFEANKEGLLKDAGKDADKLSAKIERAKDTLETFKLIAEEDEPPKRTELTEEEEKGLNRQEKTTPYVPLASNGDKMGKKEDVKYSGKLIDDLVNLSKQPDMPEISKEETSKQDELSARHTNPAKLREYGEKRDDAGRIIKRAFPIAKIEKGSEVKLKFSTDTKTTGTYSVIELDDLIPSHIEEVENPNHFVPEAQPKDRGSGDSSRKSREDIARELDPGDITRYTGNPYFGAPSINARGEVIQGNNRSDALRYTFNAYPGNYEKYRKYLLDNAETFGLSKDKLSKFKTPILVNLIDVADETMIELGQFSELDLTTGGKQDLDAKRIYNKMQDDDFSKLVNMIFSQEGSTKELIRQNGVGAVYYLLRKGYISQAQYDSAINSKTKMLTKDAVEEIQFLVTFQLFKNAPNGITIMFNQLQNNIQNVLLKNSQKIGEQKLQDRSIVKELQAAIVGYDEFKASGIKSFNAWIGQNDFINEGTPQERYSPLTLHFIEQFTQSHTAGWMKEFSNKLIDYNKSVLGDSEEENVFIPRTPLSKEDAIKTVFMEDNTDANRIRAINVGNKKKTVKKQIHQVNSEGKSAPNKKKIAELGEQLNILNAIETELKDENYVRPERIIDTTLIKTRTARRMFKKIMRDPRGKEIGVRSIMKYLVTNLPVEVRIRNEQISHQHPALYDTYGDFIRASTLSSGSYILHEAGHAIWEMMINKDKSALVSVRKTLKMITEMKNTHASANNAHEGFAEWVRRFVAYPETISDLRVNREIESYISAKYPEIWTLLKEVQQLEGAHSNRSTDAVFRSYSSDIPPVPKFSLRQAVDTIMFSAAKGWGIERTQRNLIKEMIRSEMAKGATRKSAMETARKWLKDVNENGNLQLAYHNIVRLPISIIEALQAEVGLRVKNSKGEYSKIREKNFGDIKKAVGDNRWSDFDNYIKAKVSLERYNKKGIRYPGQSDKITPKELENTVDFYEKEFPDFLQISKDLKDFTDGLVDISVLSGEKSPEEGKTIKESYELYANLRRVIQKWDVSHLSGLGNHTNPSSGYQSLRQGSANPYIDFETGIRDVVRTTFTAYYYNQLINTMVDVFEGIQKNPDLSWEVKTLAGSILSPLKLDLKVPVSLTPDEQRLIILKGINQIILNRQIKAGMEATGLSKEELKEQHPEYFTIKDKGKLELDDIQLFLANKPIFRRVKPNALNVIVYHRDGANHYLQIEDPFLFGVFAASPDAGGMLGQILKQTKVALTEVKRPVTSSLPFFIRNVFYRNPLTSILMGDDNKSLFVPFYHTLIGMFAKDKGKTEKIIGETFGRVIANRSKYPDDNYWGSIKNEIERIGITLKGYKNMSPPLKGIALLGFVVEMLVKPLNLTNAIFGLHIANLKGEEFVRRGAYLDAKMRGETDAKAEMWFDIIAGNFGEKGGFGWLAQLIGTFPFVNPAVQTLYQSTLKLTDPLAKSKNRFRLFWAGVIVPILLWLIKEAISTDEDRERMKERPEWDRYNTMDIKGLRIPFYPGGPLGILQSLTWNTLDNYTTERKIRDHKAFSVALAKKMAALPMPTQWFFAPYKAIIEVEWNHNFYLDRPVVPGWLSSLPKEEQIFYSTPEAYSTLYKAIGKFANYSPIELQHIVKSGIAQDYDEILSMLDKMKDGRLSLQYLQDNPAEIPFMSRIFIKNPMGRGSASAEELNRQIEKAPQKIQKIAEAMTKKYGNDYKNTEEYKLLVAQLQHAQNLENALEEIKKLDALIKVQRKLPEPDWRLIYAEKSQMSRIASDAMLGIKKE